MIDSSTIKSQIEKGIKFPLFDVDGTLLEGGNRAHHYAFDYALKTVYNLPNATVDEINAHGMIDTLILMEVLKLHGVSEEDAKDKIDEAMSAMVEYYEENKDENGRFVLLSGVIELLKTLQEKQIPTGLLTGNVEQIGWDKMAMAGIRDYFTFGAFGNLAFKRSDLIVIAKERLEKIAGEEIPLQQFVIIGDTPLDIACAKDKNITCIAVATGVYSAEELQKAGADLVVNSLEEKDKVLQFLNIP